VKNIHLNNAGAGLMSAETYDAVVAHLQLESAAGGYEAAEVAAPDILALREQIGWLINMDGSNVALCDSATRAWNTVIYGLSLPSGSSIVVSQLDFGSCLASLVHRFVSRGHRLLVAPSDASGRIDINRLGELLKGNIGLVGIAHAPAHISVLNPISAISQLCVERDIPLIVDACQSLGVVEFPKIAARRFAVCGTGRKWISGPRGTGFMGISSDWIPEIEPPTIELANSDPELFRRDNLSSLQVLQSAKRFELWEKSIANFLGLGVAINQIRESRRFELQPVQRLCNVLKSALTSEAREFVILPECQEGGIVAMRCPTSVKESIKNKLKAGGLNFSLNSEWDAPLDFEARGLVSTLRLSPQFFLSEAQVLEAAKVVSAAFVGIPTQTTY
jgi:cysteine desulfurase / selenocysteine lyase